MSDKVILTCSLNGVLTDPRTHPVPYTPEAMAASALQARDAGAAIVHIHIREQQLGRFPSWDPALSTQIVDAIRAAAPDLLINMTTGVVGEDISGPVGVLEATRPEMAALNAGSLNYLKLKSDGQWAWPPMLFDNPVAKVEAFLASMRALSIIPECECFDIGILRSVAMFARAGMLAAPYTVSLVQGVASGMPARADLLPILIDELPPGAPWQSIVIGRQEVWPIHQRTAELGGNLRVGLEDTFYLPDGARAAENGPLIAEMAKIARSSGREPATCAEVRAMWGLA
jgi:3-keto-5-aminohexanoate cleavage enzyme